jgi:hypothetical protein
MKAAIFIMLVTIGLSNTIHAQSPETNVAASQSAATNAPPTDSSRLLPMIKMEDVPITEVIANLAGQMEINYLIDPQLFPISATTREPIVSFTLTNVTAREVLTRMLNLRNLALIEDPVTGVARIIRADKPMVVMDASLFGMDTNHPVPSPKELIPLIQFYDVPLDSALENLSRQSGLDVVLDPWIEGKNVPTSGRLVPTPTISIRWRNITATQALIALCEAYGLVVVKDSATGVIQIRQKPSVGK